MNPQQSHPHLASTLPQPSRGTQRVSHKTPKAVGNTEARRTSRSLPKSAGVELLDRGFGVREFALDVIRQAALTLLTTQSQPCCQPHQASQLCSTATQPHTHTHTQRESRCIAFSHAQKCVLETSDHVAASQHVFWMRGECRSCHRCGC